MTIKAAMRKLLGFRFLTLLLSGGVLVLLLTGCGDGKRLDPLTLCIQHENLAMHVHATLVTVLDRQPQVLPANIGVEPECLRPLHTHEETFLVHIESPEVVAWTVGDFFRVWGTENPYQGLETESVSLNGQRYDGDYRDIPFEDEMRIIIGFASQ